MESTKRIDYDSHMRLLCFIIFLQTASLAASEPATAYPLWDNHESVADYAKKVNLPPTQTLNLGNGVKLELVLIPAGKFMMGTPEPTPVDEVGFSTKIVTAQACLAASGATLLILLGFVLVQAIRKRRRPQWSLVLLLLVTITTSGCVLSGLHWRQLLDRLQAERRDYAVANGRFRSLENCEKPAHPVTLPQPFYMGKYDVTQEQYQAVTETNPSYFPGKDNPVEQVSWNDTQVFCKKLSMERLQRVRLPTDTEWEYCCRAGTTTSYNSGDADSDLDRVAWHGGNSKNSTHPVGQKEANAFGLYDMHGNVWQWGQDWYGEDFHSLRGGSSDCASPNCRSAFSVRSPPDYRRYDVGFRVVVPMFGAP